MAQNSAPGEEKTLAFIFSAVTRTRSKTIFGMLFQALSTQHSLIHSVLGEGKMLAFIVSPKTWAKSNTICGLLSVSAFYSALSLKHLKKKYHVCL